MKSALSKNSKGGTLLTSAPTMNLPDIVKARYEQDLVVDSTSGLLNENEIVAFETTMESYINLYATGGSFDTTATCNVNSQTIVAFGRALHPEKKLR